MPTLQEYKCPCCGGAIEFDSSLQKMKCPYCDTEFDMETLASYDAGLKDEQDSMEWETSAGGEWQEGEANGLRSYICRSCGGEIVGDANTAATSCPFCGNPVVMMGQFAGALRPDFVIPFKLDKNAAKASEASDRKAASAEDIQGSEPHRRDQGRVRSVLAVRHRRGCPCQIPHHEAEVLERQRIQLHRDEPLSRTPRRQRRIRARPRGRLVENGGRSHGIDRALRFFGRG